MEEPELMKTSPLCGFLMAMSITGLYGDTITVNSSAAVTFLNTNSTSTDFPSAFTVADFTAAQAGPAASALTSVPFYIASLPSAPAAQWIGVTSNSGTTSGDTALYAISFDIPDTFVSGSLNLLYAVDNELGRTNAGVYLNGHALPGSTGIGGFNTQYTYTDANAGADLVQGTNWLYLDAVNTGFEAGLIFSADIATVNSGSATPEPASVWLFGAGLIAVSAALRKRQSER
jgi:hypothetical protein